MDYMLIVNDGGALKSITSHELAEHPTFIELDALIENAANAILDKRAIDAGEYDPYDNDAPIAVAISPEILEQHNG